VGRGKGIPPSETVEINCQLSMATVNMGVRVCVHLCVCVEKESGNVENCENEGLPGNSVHLIFQLPF